MFDMTESEIIHNTEAAYLNNPKAGAMVYFDGRVRNHNEGFKVQSLEYQCYESMAIKMGNSIIEQAYDRFDIHWARCIHRHGHLAIGDIAVWIGVSSSHRQVAFDACQFIINTVKSTVPIWKKEHYVDLAPKWVACHHCSAH